MNPVVYIGIESGGSWNCHCNSEGWYTRGCRFINFHINGNKLYYDIIFPDGRVDENKSHKIDCISSDYHNKSNLTLKFEDGTNRRRLIKITPKAHIDGMAALSDAICMRHNYYEELAGQLSNKR